MVIKIAPQIDQRLVAAADGLGIHHPGFRITRRKLKALLANGRKQFSAEHFRQGFVAEQIGFVGFGGFRPPQPFIGIDSRRRHDHMHMRVIIEPTRMGVQYANGTRFSLQLRIVVGEGFERLPAATDHQVIKGALMLPSQRAQLFGQGEGQQKIRGRHLFFEVAFQPLLALIDRSLNAVKTRDGRELP